MKKLINALKVFWLVLWSANQYCVKDKDISSNGNTFEELLINIKGLVDLGAILNNTIFDLKTSKDELHTKYTSLSEELNKSISNNKSLSAANSAGSAKLNGYIKEIAGLNLKIKDLQHTNELLEKTIADRDTEISAKDLGLKNLTRIITEKDEAINNINILLTKTKEEVKELVDRIENLTASPVATDVVESKVKPRNKVTKESK